MSESTEAKHVESSLATLEAGKLVVEAAERQLEAVLSDLRAAPRAEKTAISSAIETALSRLKTAREAVVEAEQALASEARR